MVDGTIVKVHRHGQGAKGGTQSQAIGEFRGGLSTKILALVDRLGNLVRFIFMPGQRGETMGVTSLMEGISCGAFLGDKAYDADWLREMLTSRCIESVIPARKGRKNPASHNEEKYKWRHLAESYSSMIYIAAAIINAR